MIDREEFRDLLYSIFYESVSDPAIIHKQHEKIRMWIQANIPSNDILIGAACHTALLRKCGFSLFKNSILTRFILLF